MHSLPLRLMFRRCQVTNCEGVWKKRDGSFSPFVEVNSRPSGRDNGFTTHTIIQEF